MANLPYIVQGTITDVDTTNPNGAKVVIRNDTNGETISVLTNSSGQYLGDIGNLTSGYIQTDRITVTCAFGNASNEDDFLISDNLGGVTVNLTLETVAESSDLTYCQVQDVLDELGDKTTDDISFNRVRKTVLRAEAEIDSRSGTKFSSTTITDEVYDFNQYTCWKSPEQLLASPGGTQITRNDYWNTSYNDRFKLENSPIISVTTLETNSAGMNVTDSWTELDEQSGSGGDFIVDLPTGLTTFVSKVPPFGKRRIKVTYVYGYATVPKTVERLAILLSVKSILTSTANSSQFDSTDSISLEGISISKNTGGAVSYLADIREEIKELWAIVGDMANVVA